MRNIIRVVKSKIKYNLLKTRKKNNTYAVNWAIMGLGYMANTFARALEVTEESKIIAAISRSKEKSDNFAKKHHAQYAYSTYEEFYSSKNDEIDIVYIATPLECHYENIKSVINAGYNVVCEKPICKNKNDIIELQRLAKEKKVFLMEGMWLRCMPTLKIVNEWINKGQIGNVESVRIDLSKKAIIKKESFGVILDYGIYPIALARALMPGNITVESKDVQFLEKDSDRNWMLILSNNDIRAHISISSDYEGDRQAVIFGSKGTIVLTKQFNRTNKVYCYNEKGQIIDEFNTEYLAEGFEYEIQEVQRCIKNNLLESNLVPLQSSIDVLEIIDDLRK